MLIEFRVSNYRSIGEEQIISLVPAQKQRDHKENILQVGNYQVLNAVAFYGPNSGGKSNLLLAMSLLDRLVHLSARSSSTTALPYYPFLLREGWMDKPTKFEITFIAGNSRYRYGLEFTKKQIISEWLFRKDLSREVNLFLRDNDIIDTKPGLTGGKKVIDAAIEATRPNALFLSICDMLNVEEAKKIMRWFRNFSMIDGLNTEEQEFQTVDLWQNPIYRKQIKGFLSSLRLGIADLDIRTKEFDESQLPDNMPNTMRIELAQELKNSKTYTIFSEHHFYNKDGKLTNKRVRFNFKENESQGSIRALHLSGPVLWALTNGGTLIIDEIEAKMHTILTLNTISFFLNKDTNPNNAQLIFATHDTNILRYSKLRRDQIYFAEKNAWESTEIFSLSDFKYLGEKGERVISEKERPDSDKEKRYIEGRYGAIPEFSELRSFITKQRWLKEEY